MRPRSLNCLTTLGLCREASLVSVGVITIDATKI